MKKKLIKEIRSGNLSSAFTKGEEFLKTIYDHYYTWTMLQAKYNDKKNDNTKGILSTEEFARHTNLINTQLLDLILTIDKDLQSSESSTVEEETFMSKLQNAVLGSYEIEEVLSEGVLAINYKALSLIHI